MCLVLSENQSRDFKDRVITFSTNPTLEKIPKESLENKYKYLKTLPWGFVLDIEKVYEIFLGTPWKIPEKLLIISDKNIEDGLINSDSLKKIEKRFLDLKLHFPTILYWNVNTNSKRYPSVIKKNNMEIITGFSDHIIEKLLQGKSFDPIESVRKVIFNDRYTQIGHLLA